MTQTPEPAICRMCRLPHIPGCSGAMIEIPGYHRPAGCAQFVRFKRQQATAWVDDLFPIGRLFKNSFLGNVPRGLPELAGAHAAVLAHLGAFEATGEADNVMLAGISGTGKTDLAVAAVKHAKERGMVAFFISEPDLLQRVKASYDNEDEYSEDDLMQALEQAHLVALDDFGKTKGTDFADDLIYRLVNKRYENRLPTIYTTNLSPSEFARGDRRVATTRRIRETALGILLNTVVQEIIKGPRPGKKIGK